MEGAPFTKIRYNNNDSEFLAENLGLTDPTPGDGQITEFELASTPAGDFYKTLGNTEILALTAHQLSQKSVGTNATLVGIVQKYLIWHFGKEHAVTSVINESLFEQDKNHPEKSSLRLFDKVTLDLSSIRGDQALQKYLSEYSENLAVVNTLSLLKNIIATADPAQNTLTISYETWAQAYDQWNCSSHPSVSAISTWNELIGMWQDSDPEPHWTTLVDNSWLANKLGLGLLRMGRRDGCQISAIGIRSYLCRASRQINPNKKDNPGLSTGLIINGLNAHADVTWPDSPSTITLTQSLGVSLNLELDPGASLCSAQQVETGALACNVSQPLIYLSGVRFDIDANARATEWISNKLFGDADVASYKIAAITVYNHRVCLVFQGQTTNDHWFDPVEPEHYLFLDINHFVKEGLLSLDPTGQLATSLFDEDNELYDQAPVNELQQAIIDVLKARSKTSLALQKENEPSLSQVLSHASTDLWLTGISADITGLLDPPPPDSDPQKPKNIQIETAIVNNGRVAAQYQNSADWHMTGELSLSLGLTTSMIKTSDANNALVPLSASFDLSPEQGLIRLSLEKAIVITGLSAAFDGQWNGEVLIAIPPDLLDRLSWGNWDYKTLLSELNAQILLSLQKDNQDYLVAALYGTLLETDTAAQKTRELFLSGQFALSDRQNNLRAVVSNGDFVVVQELSPSNLYLSQSYVSTAHHVATGGLINLVGQNVALALTEDNTGTWIIEPALESAGLDTRVTGQAQDLKGRIRATPVTDETGAVVAYDVAIEELGVTIPDALIVLTRETTLAGKTCVRSLTGQWRVKANAITELFTTNEDWVGQGLLSLENTGNALVAIHSPSGSRVSYDSNQVGTDFVVGNLSFAPFALAGRLTSALETGRLTLEHPLFELNTDIQGTVSAAVSQMPPVRFLTLQQNSTTAPGPTGAMSLLPMQTRVSRPRGTESQVINSEIDALFRPLIEQLRESKRSFFEIDPLSLEPNVLRNLGDSLDSLFGTVDNAALFPTAAYSSRWYTRESRYDLPLLTGFLAFLNPELGQGTLLSVPENTPLVAGNQLTACELRLNKPIHFLGFNFTGIALSKPKKASKQGQIALELLGTHGRINVMCLLNLLFPFKMCAFRKRFAALLSQTQGNQIPTTNLDHNFIPSDIGDLALFSSVLAETLGLDEKANQNQKARQKPFAQAAFDALTEKSLSDVFAKLAPFATLVRPPEVRDARSLSNYLNQLATRNDLQTVFASLLEQGMFDGPAKYTVMDLCDAAQNLAQTANQNSDKKTRVCLKKANLEMLHELMDQLVTTPKPFDSADLDRLALQGKLTPKPFDLGSVGLESASEQPVSFSFDWRPKERDVELDPTDPSTYLRLRLATGEGKHIDDVSIDFLNHYARVETTLARVSGLALDLGGPLSEPAAPFSFRLDQTNTNEDLNIFYMPEGYDRPAFAIKTQSSADTAQRGFVAASNLFINRGADGAYSAGMVFDEALVQSGFLYITSSSAETGEIFDAFIDQGNATYKNFAVNLKARAFQGLSGDLDYDFFDIRVVGDLGLDPLPENQPRAYLFLGNDAIGKRVYLVLNKLNGNGSVDAGEHDTKYAGNITINAGIPSLVYEHPAIVALEQRGFSFDINSVDIAGSLTFTMQGPESNVVRLADAPQNAFIPTSITIKGKLTLLVGGNKIVIEDLTIPIQEFALQLPQNAPRARGFEPTPVIGSLVMPAGEALSTRVTAQFDVPGLAGIGSRGLDHAAFSLVSESGITLGMTDSRNINIEGQGLTGSLKQTGTEDRLELKAKSVVFAGQQGTIDNWQLNAALSEIVPALVRVALEGKQMNIVVH